MPILYIHGVAIRSDDYWQPLEALLRTYVAPVISDDPKNVWISCCYWGDLGSKFLGRSLPDSSWTSLKDLPQKALPLAGRAGRKLSDLGTMAERKLEEAEETAKQRARQLKEKTGGHLKSAGQALVRGMEKGRQLLRLCDLHEDALSDLTAAAVAGSGADAQCMTLAAIACDEVASETSTAEILTKCQSIEEEVDVVTRLIQKRYELLRSKRGLEPRQEPVWLKTLTTDLVEGMERYADMPGYLLTRAAAEAKAPLNAFVAQFLGDVFTYMRQRGDWSQPGPIPERVLQALQLAHTKKTERHGEPLIVMTHSMGGQVFYDVITHFIPRIPACHDLRVDFWCATASQVGYFEELKLFLESREQTDKDPPDKVPRPSSEHLGCWWNVWDHNDYVSWRASTIFDDVDDERYNTGMFFVDAHGGYLVRPSFFRKFGLKVARARESNWLLSC
jgi:hypothetical protein